MENEEKVFTRPQFLTWLGFMKAIMLHEEANPDEDMISISSGFCIDDQDFYIGFRTDERGIKNICVFEDGEAAYSYLTVRHNDNRNELEFYNNFPIPFVEVVEHLLSL